MARIRHLITFSLVFYWASVASCDENDWYQADASKKLEEITNEFRANYDSVRLERRAFVCEGTWDRTRRGRNEIADIRFVSYFDRDLEFRANSYHESTQPNERWHQQLLYRGELHQRLGPFHADEFKPTEVEEEIEKARKTIGLFSPIDNSILPVQFLTGQAPHSGADAKLSVGKLVSGEFGPDGTIIQKILRDGGIRPVQDQLVWSRVDGTDAYFPIQFELMYVEKDGKLRRGSVIKTEWKKNNDWIVPTSMSFWEARANYSIEAMITVEYLFGNQIGESPIVKPEMQDWREPIRLLFDKEWLRRGGPTRLIRPIDLPLP